MQNFNTDEEKIKHNKQKKRIRIIGFVLAIIGAILAAIGLIDFFAHMSLESGMPTLFFCAFIGIPLFAIGVAMILFSYFGEINSYVSKEAKPGIQHVTNSIAEVVEDSKKVIKDESIRCSHCQTVNDSNARFCSYCGKPLRRTCPSCGKEVKPDSNYCDNCGQKL